MNFDCGQHHKLFTAKCYSQEIIVQWPYELIHVLLGLAAKPQTSVCKIQPISSSTRNRIFPTEKSL